MQENRTDLQIFLSKDGPRVDCGIPEGFFRKTPGPNRYPRILAVGSRSGGLDLNGGGDLILTTGSGSDGFSGFGRGAAAERSPAGYFMVAHSWGSPDRAELGRPGTKLSAAWL